MCYTELMERVLYPDIPEIAHLTQMNAANLSRFEDCSVSAYAANGGYPLTNWMLGGAMSERKLHTLWHANLCALLGNALVVAESPDARGMAVWAKADFEGINAGKFLLHGGSKLLPHIPRMLSYESYANKLKAAHVAKDAWYLYDLAVAHEFQGQKIAALLIRPMLSFFDRTGADCFLETHNQKNVPMYEHFGFCLVETGLVPKSGLKHYAMLRKPQPQQKEQ